MFPQHLLAFRPFALSCSLHFSRPPLGPIRLHQIRQQDSSGVDYSSSYFSPDLHWHDHVVPRAMCHFRCSVLAIGETETFFWVRTHFPAAAEAFDASWCDKTGLD